MKVVALIGADGSGKTMIARELERRLGRPAKYLYMGVNVDASNVMLPTTWLWRKLRRATGTAEDMGRPRDRTPKRSDHTWARRCVVGWFRVARLLNLIAEELFRKSLATVYCRRRYIVLCDRDYFLDFYAHDVVVNERRSWDRAVHGFFLKHFYPRPDLVLMLDAPAETLHARKEDSSIDEIESRRAEYYQARKQIEHFQVINVARSPDAVIREARRVILNYCEPGSEKAREATVA